MAEPLRRNRDFAILWSGEAVSELGSAMSSLVLPLLGYALTGSTAQAGLAATAALVAALAFRLPAGVLVDRLPRGRVLLAANMGNALLFTALAVVTVAHVLTIGLLVVIAALTGIAASFAGPAMSASVRAVVSVDQRPVAYARIEARGHAAALIGPPLGGALYSVTRALPFAVDAVSYVLAAASVRLLRADLGAPVTERRTMVRELCDGMAFLWRSSAVRALMLWGALINLAGLLVFVTVTLRLVKNGVHPAAIGAIDSVASLAGLIGALAAPDLIRRTRTGVMTLATGSIVAVAFALMATTAKPVILGLFLAIGTFLLPANNAGISAYLSNVVPDHMQGRFNAAAGLVAGGLTPAAPLLAGLLLASVGAVPTTLIGAAVVLTSLIPLLATPAIRGLGRPVTWAAQAED